MRLFMDIECYRNYFLVMFLAEDGRSWAFEQFEGRDLDIESILKVIRHQKLELITFNGLKYDIPLLSVACLSPEHQTCDQIKYVSDSIIIDELQPWQVKRKFGVELLEPNHIDLIEPSPGIVVSLKLHAGRLHSKKMQDLPIEPHAHVSEEQRALLKTYCRNDLENTRALFESIKGRIDLRRQMSEEYGVDLRSRSDAQIAEQVLAVECARITGAPVKRGSMKYIAFKYDPPSYIKFHTDILKNVFSVVCESEFTVKDTGYVEIPKDITKLDIRIGNTVYKFSIGGLHSQEESVTHHASEEVILADHDVVSYYPNLILNMGEYPESMGVAFLTAYKGILDARLKAKAENDKVKQESLKIVLNGTYGKTSSRYSLLYNPKLTMQVTLTGQLSLLMLIEAVERAGISVVSANTDGVVMKCPARLERHMKGIIAAWEKCCNLKTEETRYKSVYSRDVNNYIAIKTDGKVKRKGVFAETSLMKTPNNEICYEAVIKHLVDGVDMGATVMGCTDIRKFVTVRTVSGGAMKDGADLGKVIRWYYATGVEGVIRDGKTFNTVSRSEGAKPMMQLPDDFPSDIDYSWYIKECDEILMDLGAKVRPKVDKIPRKNSKEWKQLLADGKIAEGSGGKYVWTNQEK